MNSFKKFLLEADAPVQPVKPGSPPSDIPPYDPYFDTVSTTNTVTVGGGDIFGIGNAKNLPIYNPFSPGLDPGKDTNGRVNGGGGFTIEKQSRDFMIALAKLYGIDIETQESMQKKQQQGQIAGTKGGPAGSGGGDPSQMMRMMQQSGMGQGKPQPQEMPQQGGMPGMGGEEKINHLIQQTKVHPAMYLMNMDPALNKEFDKIFKGMQDWKLADKNPDEGKDWYTLWKEKQKKNVDQNKMNLSRMTALTLHRERATDLYNRLKNVGLAPETIEDNPHILDYLNPENHFAPSTEYQDPQELQKQDDEDNNYDDAQMPTDAETGYDRSYQGE